MSRQVMNAHLERDGPQSPWGFRLQGGMDVGLPLTIQRVCLGTASEGELKRGDVVLQIGNRDATRITHQDAHDLIKSAGNHLTLVIQRLQTGGAQTPLPTSSSSFTGGHPLSPAAFPSSTPAMNRTYNPSSRPGLFQTSLPTTQFSDTFRPYVPDPENLAAAEMLEYYEEKRRENNAIVHQAYRTNPIITPKAKTKHDLPMGSYLRHVHDPNWQHPPHPGATPVQNPTVMRKLQEVNQVTATAHVPSFTATNPNKPDEPVSVLLKQYNSPINIYSPQSVAETLSAQTGLQPPNNNSYSAGNNPASSKHLGKPIKVIPQPYNIADITMSPTYRLIHDEEWKDLKKSELREQPAVQQRVHDVAWAADAPVNALGVPRGKISQSGSFNTIKNTLVFGQSQY